MAASFSMLKFKSGATPIILALLLISTFLLLVTFGPGIGDRLGFLSKQKEREQPSEASEQDIRLIVTYKPATKDAEKDGVVSDLNVDKLKRLKVIDADVVVAKANQIERIKNNPKVLRVEEDVKVQALIDWCAIFRWLCQSPSPTPAPSPISQPSPSSVPSPVASASPAPTLSVVLSGRVLSTQSFSSTGVSGTAPLSGVDLSGSVSGTATGNIRYRFDCTNNGTYERDATTTINPYSISDVCTYSAAGSYTASVRVDRQGVFVTDTLPITVAIAPSPSPLPSPSPSPLPSPSPIPSPILGNQSLPWGVDRIDADRIWSTTTADPVKVAIIDSGADLDHPDLAANIKGGVNTIDPQLSADDDNGHGSHVTGTIAALNNTIGVVGVGPAIDIYAVKALNSSGGGFLSDVIEGLQWCIDNNIKVVNMSFGLTVDVVSFHNTLIAAQNAGITLVAAAGNNGPGDNSVFYPAKYPEVIAVAATNQSNGQSDYSSRGPEVDLAAPGDSIYSTLRGGSYGTYTGTSMASPHVAGAAALVLASHPNFTPVQIQAHLQSTAERLANLSTNQQGAGLVDAEKAVITP